MSYNESFESVVNLPFASGDFTQAPRVKDPVINFKLQQNGKAVTLFNVHAVSEVPRNLVSVLQNEFNFIVEEGQTYPYIDVLGYDEFVQYWFHHFVAILIEGNYASFEDPQLQNLSVEQWHDLFLGSFYVKPNYVGRCSHVCNAGFAVNHVKRGSGLGKELGAKYLQVAPQLGYVYSVFNLVFETNVASLKIWDSLGFERIGHVVRSSGTQMMRPMDRERLDQSYHEFHTGTPREEHHDSIPEPHHDVNDDDNDDEFLSEQDFTSRYPEYHPRDAKKRATPASMPQLNRHTILLKDGVTTATIYPIAIDDRVPFGLVQFLCEEFNMEIERGETLPFFDPLSVEDFTNYWFDSFVAIMCLGDSLDLNEDEREWERECLGTFCIKPNYPGRRCSHICTAEFLVNAGIRGKGVGRTLTDCFLRWAPKLGYTYAILNLVFETNAAARKLWESMNFKRVGKVANAAYVKNSEVPVDAIIYERDLSETSTTESHAYRFDKIKYYLETGKYPATADRQEKARLRSGALKYTLEKGKLMIKGKEVIADPDSQLRVCQMVHRENNHCGINRSTTLVAEKYHWQRIKDTMSVVVKNCEQCNANANIDSNDDVHGNKRRRVDEEMEETALAARVSAVVAEVKENYREGYRPSYAEVAASSLSKYPQYKQVISDSDVDHQMVQPRVRKYH
ncbi:uncharacterized protein LODBEIA_P14680 [Lodderomyces beijingensis]|uniref:N-acetyltransferase domain-containing protein n=1 Tax=Lodderomyces beijingensis TaxID=1775926 RepID=A0ABP0ZGG0_9ASCO